MIDNQFYQSGIKSRIESEKASVAFSKIINELWYDKGIETLLFRNPLLDKRNSEILNLHHYAREVVGHSITIHDTLSLAEAMSDMDLCPARLDIGKLTAEWMNEGEQHGDVHSFLADKLRSFIGAVEKNRTEPRDVVLYGFGRIGRLVARELLHMEGKGEQLRLRAVVTRDKGAEALEKEPPSCGSILFTDLFRGP